MQTTPQLRNTSYVLTVPFAHAIASRLLPVNSSAPATEIRISPSENATPPSSLVAAKPSDASLAISANMSAPRPMKAPANMPSSDSVKSGRPALTTPNSPTRRAISFGA